MTTPKQFCVISAAVLGAYSAMHAYAANNNAPGALSQYGQIQAVKNYSSNPFWNPNSPYNQKTIPKAIYVTGTDLTTADCNKIVENLVSQFCASNKGCAGMQLADARPKIMVQLSQLPGHNYATACGGYIDSVFSKYEKTGLTIIAPLTTTTNTNNYTFQNPYAPTLNAYQAGVLERTRELEELQAQTGTSVAIESTEFPKTVADISFIDRMANAAAGYEPYKEASAYKIPKFEAENSPEFLERSKQYHCYLNPDDPGCPGYVDNPTWGSCADRSGNGFCWLPRDRKQTTRYPCPQQPNLGIAGDTDVGIFGTNKAGNTTFDIAKCQENICNCGARTQFNANTFTDENACINNCAEQCAKTLCKNPQDNKDPEGRDSKTPKAPPCVQTALEGVPGTLSSTSRKAAWVAAKIQELCFENADTIKQFNNYIDKSPTLTVADKSYTLDELLDNTQNRSNVSFEIFVTKSTTLSIGASVPATIDIPYAGEQCFLYKRYGSGAAVNSLFSTVVSAATNQPGMYILQGWKDNSNSRSTAGIIAKIKPAGSAENVTWENINEWASYGADINNNGFIPNYSWFSMDKISGNHNYITARERFKLFIRKLSESNECRDLSLSVYLVRVEGGLVTIVSEEEFVS